MGRVEEQRTAAVRLPVSPGFYGELWMSLVDTYDPAGDASDGRREVVEAFRASDARGVRGSTKWIELSPAGAAWLREWLTDEVGFGGRWADWGFEGQPWIRAGRKMIERIDEATPVRVMPMPSSAEERRHELADERGEGEWDV